MSPDDVGSEGQVLHRGPHDVAADGCQVEVRVAGRTDIGNRQEVGADQSLATVTVVQRTVGTVNGSRPVRAPVVGVATAEAPGLDSINTGANPEDAVRETSEAGALVSAIAAAAEHQDGLREQALE